MQRIGVQTSIAGGLHMAIKRAYELGCSTVQLFSHNPRGWALKEIQTKEKTQFKSLRRELNITPVYVHCSYLVNIASHSSEIRRKSIAMLEEEMKRTDIIGADYLILHVGGRGGTSTARTIEGIKRVAESRRWMQGLLLENTAITRLGILGEVMGSVSDLISGICIDTCHAFQAGYDLRGEKGIQNLYDEIERHIGFSKVKLIHLNDSKAGIGLHLDRHEHLGMGRIGFKGLKRFIRRFSEIPIILETPKKTELDDIRNLKELRRMLR